MRDKGILMDLVLSVVTNRAMWMPKGSWPPSFVVAVIFMAPRGIDWPIPRPPSTRNSANRRAVPSPQPLPDQIYEGAGQHNLHLTVAHGVVGLIAVVLIFVSHL